MRKIFLALTLLLLTSLLIGEALAAQEVIFIKSPGCHKCASAQRTLGNISATESINITEYDYFSDEGKKIIKAHKTKDVPALIIGGQVINYRDYDEDTGKLDRMIRAALKGERLDLIANQSPEAKENLDLSKISTSSLMTVFGAGFFAGFNPCLLGILVFLSATVLSSSGRRRDLITMIVAFSAGIFVMYLLFGLGMQRLLQAKAVANSFRYILTAFLIIMGLTQIEDAIRLNSGKDSLFKTTEWIMDYFKAGASQGKISSYFLMGALFSLVKLACVSAVYLAILDAISSKNYAEGVTCLIFYNLGILAPILILGTFIAIGMSPEKIDKFRKDYRAAIRLFTGLAFIALAPLIYYQII